MKYTDTKPSDYAKSQADANLTDAINAVEEFVQNAQKRLEKISKFQLALNPVAEGYGIEIADLGDKLKECLDEVVTPTEGAVERAIEVVDFIIELQELKDAEDIELCMQQIASTTEELMKDANQLPTVKEVN